MRTPAAIAVGAGLAAIVAAPQAHALDVSVTGDAADCASEDGFLERLRSRSPRAGERATSPLRVHVARTAAGFEGTIELPSPDGGAPVSRAAAGGRCDEVLDALALIAAIALDAEPPPPPPPRPPPADATRPAPAAARRPTERPDPQPPPRGERSELAIALTLGAVWGPLPAAAPALDARLEVARASRGPLSIAARVGAGGLLSRSAARDGGVVAVSLLRAYADVCPLAWPRQGASTHVELCGRAEVGRLAAEASGFEGARADARLWGAVGGALTARLRLAPRAFALAEGSVVAPLARDAYVFSRSPDPVHRIGPWAVGVAMGMGATF